MASWQIVFLVTIGYLLLSLAIGLASGRRASATSEGYVAGDRALGFVILYFIMGASIFSAFAFLGGPGWAYSRGAAAFYIISYTSVGLVPWYFVGPKIARLGRRFGYLTQAQLFGHRYESRYIPALLALVSLAAFVPYLTIQMQGAGYVFSVVTEGRMPVWAGAAVAYGVVLYPTFQFFVLPILLIGFSGILAFPGVRPADTILPTIVTSMGLPALVVGLFCAGALAASMSSGDAIVHAAASILVKDFYAPLHRAPLDDARQTRWIKILVIVIGAVSYYFAIYSEASLVFLLLLSYGAIAQIFPALLAALYWPRSTAGGVLAGLTTGCFVTLIWNLYPALQWQEIHPGIWGLAANTLVLLSLSRVTSPASAERVREFAEA